MDVFSYYFSTYDKVLRILPYGARFYLLLLIILQFDIVNEIMKRFKEVFFEMSTNQQRKQLIHLLVSKITINKERKIDSIEIQINDDVTTYLMKDRLPKEQGNLSFLHLLGMNCVNLKIVI